MGTNVNEEPLASLHPHSSAGFVGTIRPARPGGRRFSLVLLGLAQLISLGVQQSVQRIFHATADDLLDMTPSLLLIVLNHVLAWRTGFFGYTAHG
jgi:hypothetical protein